MTSLYLPSVVRAWPAYMAWGMLKEQSQLQPWVSPPLLLLAMPSQCSFWGDSRACVSHIANLNAQADGIKGQDEAVSFEIRWAIVKESEGKFGGWRQGWRVERGEIVEKGVVRIKFITAFPFHQWWNSTLLGHIMKTYPKTRVNSDLQLISKLLPVKLLFDVWASGAFGAQQNSELRN